jgi:hypothetical protein
MERRQNNGERCHIVQKFIEAITDDKTRIVCYMYMKNCTDKEICKQLKCKPADLKLLKLQLAFDLRKVGIRM